MTFTHWTDSHATTSTCTRCGDFITSVFGLVIARFERTHECERAVA